MSAPGYRDHERGAKLTSERKVPARWQGTPAEPYWMNPEACARLVAEHGSQRAAGRAIGVPNVSFGRWMKPELREKGAEYHRRYREENREKLAERKRKYRAENQEVWRKWYAENREKVLERHRRYCEENREKRREYCRKYDEEHREQKRAYNKKLYEENSERLRKYAREYRGNNAEKVSYAQLMSRLRVGIKRKRSRIQQLEQELANA